MRIDPQVFFSVLFAQMRIMTDDFVSAYLTEPGKCVSIDGKPHKLVWWNR